MTQITESDKKKRDALVIKYNRAKTKTTKHKIYAELMQIEDKYL